jgi:hypothetical protein
MATQLSSLITVARDLLNEPVASFWTDAELLRYMNGAIRDLYRRIKDQQQDEFFVEDTSNVTALAGTRALSGWPTNVAEIRGIRPRDGAAYPTLRFWPRKWTDYDFQASDLASDIDPRTGGDLYYVPVGASGPVGTMQVLIAPRLTADVPLTVAYVPSRDEITVATTVNPIPGESDMALVYYAVAHALARTPHGDVASLHPHPGYLQLFEQEAAKILVATSPRQSDEPLVTEALFELYWP